MGAVESAIDCKTSINPELLSVVTLSDSAVQRLPLGIDDSPLEKEQRNRNIDDYWRERLECMEQAYSEAQKITEEEFQRLEFELKKMSSAPSPKPLCLRVLEDSKTCYLTYPDQPLNCRQIIQKLQLCLDTIMQEGSKKKEEERKKREEKEKKEKKEQKEQKKTC